MLGLHVDVAKSRALTQAIAGARAGGASAAVIAGAGAPARAIVDQRFDPAQALAATVRYLELGRSRFGRQDLAFVSYHMGMGNLVRVLDAYDGGTPVPYVQLFFDTAPDRHGAAYAALSGFSDQSWLYYWRVLGAAAASCACTAADPGALDPPGHAADRAGLLSGGPASARPDPSPHRSAGPR